VLESFELLPDTWGVGISPTLYLQKESQLNDC